MKEYEVRVIETASRVVTVTSSSAENAERIVKAMYRDEEIILDYGDYDYTEFTLLGEVVS